MELNDREQTILRLWNEGMNSKKLAKAVRCSARTLNKIVAKFEAAGLVTRPPLSVLLAGGRDWPAERTDRLKELFAQGLPLSDIAKALGVTRGAVSGQAAKVGLTRDPATTAMNKARANAQNTAHLRAMNEARRGRPRTDLKGPRGPRNTFNVKPSGPRLAPKSFAYRPTEVELSASKSIMELGPFHCRFPISEGDSGLMDGTRFCGCYKPSKKPYCDEHAKLCTVQRPESVESFMRSLRRWAA